jgi:hypothetical protein
LAFVQQADRTPEGVASALGGHRHRRSGLRFRASNRILRASPTSGTFRSRSGQATRGHGAPVTDTVQKLFDSWDEGEEENYPGAGRVLVSDIEISMFETRHGVVLPALAKEFYRRVNGMTLAEFERDTNHFLVKFFPLQEVTPCDGLAPHAAPGSSDGQLFRNRHGRPP